MAMLIAAAAMLAHGAMLPQPRTLAADASAALSGELARAADCHASYVSAEVDEPRREPRLRMGHDGHDGASSGVDITPACCPLATAAILPEFGLAAPWDVPHGRLQPPRAPLLEGLPPGSPMKPPRTTDQV